MGCSVGGCEEMNGHTGQMIDMPLDQEWALCDKECG